MNVLNQVKWHHQVPYLSDYWRVWWVSSQSKCNWGTIAKKWPLLPIWDWKANAPTDTPLGDWAHSGTCLFRSAARNKVLEWGKFYGYIK